MAPFWLTICRTKVIKSSISWDDVVSKRELQFDDALLDLMKDINFCWYNLSSNPSFIPSIDSLKRAFEKSAEINWSALSKNQQIDLSFVREYKDFLDWKILTSNKKVVDINEENILDEFAKLLDWSYVSENIKLTNHILVKYKDSLIWKIVNERFNYNEFDLSNIETVKDFVDWTKLSSASIVFPEEFLHQYRNKIDWVAFSKNDSVDFSADLYKDFEKELNRVKFVDILSHCNTNGYSSLKVYHFSHMFNAIDIIKNRKILSRHYLHIGLSPSHIIQKHVICICQSVHCRYSLSSTSVKLLQKCQRNAIIAMETCKLILHLYIRLM